MTDPCNCDLDKRWIARQSRKLAKKVQDYMKQYAKEVRTSLRALEIVCRNNDDESR